MHDHSGGASKKWRQNFHIRRNHFGLGGTQIGFCCFLFIYQVSKRLWQKIDPNYKSTTVFNIFNYFFFGIEFFLSNISSISTKRFQIKTYLNKKERVVGFLSTDITHKIALDIHRMNKNVVKIQLKSIWLWHLYNFFFSLFNL